MNNSLLIDQVGYNCKGIFWLNNKSIQDLFITNNHANNTLNSIINSSLLKELNYLFNNQIYNIVNNSLTDSSIIFDKSFNNDIFMYYLHYKNSYSMNRVDESFKIIKTNSHYFELSEKGKYLKPYVLLIIDETFSKKERINILESLEKKKKVFNFKDSLDFREINLTMS
jgi:hypothetical protein